MYTETWETLLHKTHHCTYDRLGLMEHEVGPSHRLVIPSLKKRVTSFHGLPNIYHTGNTGKFQACVLAEVIYGVSRPSLQVLVVP